MIGVVTVKFPIIAPGNSIVFFQHTEVKDEFHVSDRNALGEFI
jgi:hypothetical protein